MEKNNKNNLWTDTEVKAANILAEFLENRTLSELNRAALKAEYGIPQADLMVLFGGSILEGINVFIKGIQNGISEHTMIVGGAGHTTDSLRQKMEKAMPEYSADRKTEAEMFQDLMNFRSGLKADDLETESTNCGNNIVYILDHIKQHFPETGSVLMIQDATMQKRMEATLRKEAPDLKIISYPAYSVRFTGINEEGELVMDHQPEGMWNSERYLSLLMGEIPRLKDDENGYGPCGKNFISHVDIPADVLKAWQLLQQSHPELVRSANPSFASKA